MDIVSTIAIIVDIGTEVIVVLNSLIDALEDAPKVLKSLCAELYAVNDALLQIRTWFENPKLLPPMEVQRDVKTVMKLGAWSRTVWLMKETSVLRPLRRIESHKSSLNLTITAQSRYALFHPTSSMSLTFLQPDRNLSRRPIASYGLLAQSSGEETEERH